MIYLFLGSFNPIHAAHKAAVVWALANGADEVWIVVSPQNPMKSGVDMAPLNHRVAMVELAMQGVEGVRVMDFEKDLPAPHYTINAIQFLQQKYPSKEFAILCGCDIVEQFASWHRASELEQMVTLKLYPRTILPVSSTEIRSGQKLDALDDKVVQYIKDNKLYISHLERAKEFFAIEQFGNALNELAQCDSGEAATLTEIITNILSFRNTDIYNP